MQFVARVLSGAVLAIFAANVALIAAFGLCCSLLQKRSDLIDKLSKVAFMISALETQIKRYLIKILAICGLIVNVTWPEVPKLYGTVIIVSPVVTLCIM